MNEMTTIDPRSGIFGEAKRPSLRASRSSHQRRWVDSSHDKVLEVEDPRTATIVSHVVDASDKDVPGRSPPPAAYDDIAGTAAPMVREPDHEPACRPAERDADLLAELEAIDNGQAQGHGRRGRRARRDQPDPLHGGWASKSAAR